MGKRHKISKCYRKSIRSFNKCTRKKRSRKFKKCWNKARKTYKKCRGRRKRKSNTRKR